MSCYYTYYAELFLLEIGEREWYLETMMKRFLTIVILLFPAAFLWSTEGKTVFKVTNNTGFILSALYIDAAKSEEWNENILEGTPLLNGESVFIPLITLKNTVVDIRAKDEEGDTYTIFGVNVEDEDVTIFLQNIDPD